MPPLPPFTPPLTDSSPKYHIIIRHPAYPDTERPLLRLAALDGDDGDGLNYDFALVACGSFTGNTWSTGYLATKDAEENFSRVERPANGILKGSAYYYMLSTCDAKRMRWYPP